jgi:hypothetical protein
MTYYRSRGHFTLTVLFEPRFDEYSAIVRRVDPEHKAPTVELARYFSDDENDAITTGEHELAAAAVSADELADV